MEAVTRVSEPIILLAAVLMSAWFTVIWLVDEVEVILVVSGTAECASTSVSKLAITSPIRSGTLVVLFLGVPDCASVCGTNLSRESSLVSARQNIKDHTNPAV